MKIRPNPLFPAEISSLSNALGVLWRELAATVNKLVRKYQDEVNVKDYGAKGDGTTDDTVAFGAAATAAIAKYNTFVSWENVTNPLMATVYIPPGNYILSDYVKTDGNLINWEAQDGAFFVNDCQLYLGNGSLRRPRRSSCQAVGTQDSTTTQVISTGYDYERPAAITGLTADTQLATSAERGACALALLAMHSKTYLIDENTTTYTTTGVTTNMSTLPYDVNELVKGMIIQVPAYGSDSDFAGRLSSWSADGKTLTVTGWYEWGNTASGQTPTNNAPAYVNYKTKVWASDALVKLQSTDVADWACGHEVNLENLRGDYDPVTEDNDIGGYDVGAAGAGTNYMYHYGFRARENGYYAFKAEGAITAGFAVEAVSDTYTPTYGFLYKANTTSTTKYPVEVQRLYSGTYRTVFRINADGNVEIGRNDATDLPAIDFHSSGNAVDYDARIQCSGGSGTAGAGELFFNATTSKTKNVIPNAADTHNIGTAANRYDDVFAVNFDASQDVIVDSSSYGLVLRSPDGTYWRVKITNAGALTTTSLSGKP
jgi:hypothetical protein